MKKKKNKTQTSALRSDRGEEEEEEEEKDDEEDPGLRLPLVKLEEELCGFELGPWFGGAARTPPPTRWLDRVRGARVP